MGAKIADNYGITLDELKTMLLPLVDEDGTVQHKAKIMVNNERLMRLIGETSLPKDIKRKVHISVVQFINTMNSCGIYQYLPDKFKPVIAVLFAMDILSSESFTKMLREDK